MDSAQVSGSDSYPLPSPDPVVACAQYNLEEPSSPVGCWLLVVASEHSAIVERGTVAAPIECILESSSFQCRWEIICICINRFNSLVIADSECA
eukprot:CAMPEP_0169386106 /NCGR_PEP_ID=MMETSP1017-20121227/44525_1 /TAXON_ID=342587 /ORGANISM="Karlodinium micrum, Strain CCMP2283" /LENGTH=93 /DNA_ID=CAMNT_0009487191 /DNA_START=212 /DNA_END=493 /DNA_ORIENTATION=-